jgi:hypothetical protein
LENIATNLSNYADEEILWVIFFSSKQTTGFLKMSSNTPVDKLKVEGMVAALAEAPVCVLVIHTLLSLYGATPDVVDFAHQIEARMPNKPNSANELLFPGVYIEVDFSAAIKEYAAFNDIEVSQCSVGKKTVMLLNMSLALAKSTYVPKITFPRAPDGHNYQADLDNNANNLRNSALKFWQLWKTKNEDLWEKLRRIAPDIDWSFKSLSADPAVLSIGFDARAELRLSVRLMYETNEPNKKDRKIHIMSNPDER